MIDIEQIEKCQNTRLGYLAWHVDAERRDKAGERQVYCETCRRWQWPDQLCALAVVKARGAADEPS